MKNKGLIILVAGLLVVLAFGCVRDLGAHSTPLRASSLGPMLPGTSTRRQYTLNARIRPLFITREGIGGGRIVWTDGPDDAKGLELLIGSDPARAPRRINRWGYIAERIDGSSAELLGVMTQSDEQSMEQASAGVSQSCKKHAFLAIRCRLSSGQAQSTVIRLLLSEDLDYRDVDALLGRLPQSGDTTRSMTVPNGAEPGFLFTLKAMVHETVEAYRRWGLVRTTQQKPRKYIYNASLFELNMRSSRILRDIVVNGRPYGPAISSEFEARNTVTGENTSFAITYGTAAPVAEIPIRIVYRPRWWFELELLLEGEAETTQAAER